MKPFSYLLPILFGLASCTGNDVPSGDPSKGVHPETYGVQVRGDRVIDKDLKIHWLQEYVSGYTEPDESAKPATLKPLLTSANCRPPRPRAGSLLAQVLTDHGNGAVPLHWLSADGLKDYGERLVGVLHRNVTPELMLKENDRVFNRIDVIVTEASQPVHLILAARGPTFWHIQKSDKASISGITLISGTDAVAIGNVDSSIPISALTGKAAEQCGAVPAYWPVMQYPGMNMQIHKAAYPEQALAKQQAAYASYNGFFKSAFGQSATDVSVGAESVDHAVVGPLPPSLEERVPFHGYENTNIYVTPAALTVFATDREYAPMRRAAVIKSASQLTGADYEKIMQQAGY